MHLQRRLDNPFRVGGHWRFIPRVACCARNPGLKVENTFGVEHANRLITQVCHRPHRDKLLRALPTATDHFGRAAGFVAPCFGGRLAQGNFFLLIVHAGTSTRRMRR
jgi:hypothetical protein